MTAESSARTGSEPAGAEPPGPAPETRPKDLKDKFREALERKRGKQVEAAALAAHPEASKIRGAHGPAASQRSFRRKSG